MRWIEDAVQAGRDQEASPDTLLPVSTITTTIEERKRAETARLKEEERKRDESKCVEVIVQDEEEGSTVVGRARQFKAVSCVKSTML